MESRRNFTRVLAAAAVLSLACAQQPPGPGEVKLSNSAYRPPTQYKFEADTKTVEVGVVVRDPQGHAVPGLTKEDFEITDEGHKRTIASFSVETSVPPAAAPAASATPPPGTAATVRPAASQRYIAIVFDDRSMELGEMVAAQAAALHFVKDGLREGDHAGLFTLSGENNLPFTTDAAKLADAVEKLHFALRQQDRHDCPGMSPYEAYLIANRISLETFTVKMRELARCQGQPSNFPDMTGWDGAPPQGRGQPQSSLVTELASQVSAQAGSAWRQVTLWARTDLITIGQVVDSVAQMNGSRTVLLTSSGFLTKNLEQDIDLIVRRALRAGVVINSIDAKGLFTTSLNAEVGAGGRMDARSLKNMQSIALTSKEAANDGPAVLATSTGGLFFHNRNDIDAGFSELGIRPEVSYLLSFTPEEAPNGKYHQLKVRLKNPAKNTVQARLGYVALKPSAAPPMPQPERPIDTVAKSDKALDDFAGGIAVRPMVTPQGERALMTVFSVDIQKLRFKEEAGERRQKVSLIVTLTDSDGNYVTGKEGTIDFALKDQTYRTYATAGMSFSIVLVAPPGPYKLRAVIADSLDGKTTAQTIPAEIK